MKLHAAILNCDHNTLSLGRESKVTIPIALKHQPVLSNASRAVDLLVHSPCDLEIPARSVQLILGTEFCGLVEPVETLPSQLHIARSLSSCTYQFKF